MGYEATHSLQVNLEQLVVQLGTGTLELRGVLLNCAYLNERLVSKQSPTTASAVHRSDPFFTIWLEGTCEVQNAAADFKHHVSKLSSVA